MDFQVVDREDSQPLPDAKVVVEAEFDGKIYIDSATTDVNGRVIFQRIPKCGMLTKIRGVADGYFPDSIENKLPSDLAGEIEPNRQLKLRPITQKLVFFVEDCKTKRRLPGVSVVIELDNKGKKDKQSKRTNVNGVGKGEYDEVHEIAEVTLTGSHPPYYKDGSLPTHKVRDFIKLPDSLRTICLEPIPNMVKFKNVDSLCNKPMGGVKNIVTITNGGTTKTETVLSNKGGEFAFQISPGDVVSVVSKYPPDYKDNTDKIKNIDGIKLKDGASSGRTIPLSPQMVRLQFRTVEEKKQSQTVPNADVKITIDVGCRSIALSPPNQSNHQGEFVVNIPINAQISIAASKAGYGANNTKILDKSVRNLQTAPQRDRDIPLKKKPNPKPEPPKKNCRAFFAGTLVGGQPQFQNVSVIFEEDSYSEYVGSGHYPDNSVAFPKAHATSFDGIAIGKGTRVIIYSKKNFKGKILFDKKGPVVLNNGKHRAGNSSVNSEIYPGNLQALFPLSVRSWSTSDMNAWSDGSMKIICGE